MAKDSEYFFKCLLTISVASLGNCLLSSLAH